MFIEQIIKAFFGIDQYSCLMHIHLETYAQEIIWCQNDQSVFPPPTKKKKKNLNGPKAQQRSFYFLAPLAIGQCAYVIAHCLSYICLYVNFFFKHLL